MTTPHAPTKYTGPNVYVNSVVIRDREPTGADFRQPETGKLYPIGCIWQVGKTPTTGVEGELWCLSKIVANVAYWIQIPDATYVASAYVTDAGTAIPAGGILDVNGGTGINTSGSGHQILVNLTVPVTVPDGGTGDTSFTPYAVITGGTTSTGNLQNVVGVGTIGEVLTSNGAGTLPTWQNGASVHTITTVNHSQSPYAVLSTDQFIACQTSTGTITIELPNTTSTGRIITIKDSNGDAATSNISVTTVGGILTIDGQTTYSLVSNYGAISVIFDGTNYEVF